MAVSSRCQYLPATMISCQTSPSETLWAGPGMTESSSCLLTGEIEELFLDLTVLTITLSWYVESQLP